MPFSNTLPMNRFHAPLREKTSDELLYAIAKSQNDSDACRAELIRQGWTESQIAPEVARWANVAATNLVNETSRCLHTITGQHSIQWAAQPARIHNGHEVHPAMRRGVCLVCDETFTV